MLQNGRGWKETSCRDPCPITLDLQHFKVGVKRLEIHVVSFYEQSTNENKVSWYVLFLFLLNTK